jgi:tetratricopeptide (TPR) repeat protein
MSFDKTKAMRNAERFLSQGKIRAAISEYEKIVENDPKDFSTLNILGDLYVKSNETSQAVACFKQVAEHYSKQGFAQKAIAIYNKISRIEPNSTEVSEKLAQLYQSKGSFAEARLHYTALAEQYQQRGQQAEALEIWKQIAQLDPGNTEVYLKIAEFCWQNNQKDETAKALTEAGMRFLNFGQEESALTAFLRALEIRPYDLAALNGYVKAQIKLGYADEAAERLEKILEQSPYNREILYLLIDCYIDSNNPTEAEKAVVRLVEQEPANYPKFLELTELYLKNNDLDSAARILSMSSEHLLVGGKHDEFFQWVNEILARNPEQIDALKLLVRFYGWQRDEKELKKSLERLAEVARLHNLIDDERHALSQLVLIVPHEIEYAKRLQEINIQFGNLDQTPTGNLIGSSDTKPDFEQEQFSSFDNFGATGNFDIGESSDVFLRYNQSENIIASTLPQEDFGYDVSLNGNGAKSRNLKVSASEEVLTITDSDVSFCKEEFTNTGGTFEREISSDLKLSEELRLTQEIEGIEFYIDQGYRELAEKALAELEEDFGLRPEIARLRERMGDSSPKLTEQKSDSGELPEKEEKTEKSFQTEAEQKATVNLDDFLSEFRSELGLEETESTDGQDYETHYHLAIAYKEMGLLEDAIREFQDAVNLVQPDDGTRRFFQCCNLLGHCFTEKNMSNLALIWYHRALETPHLNDNEKRALLYEIAGCYENSGEVSKAIEYFEQIYAADVDYRDVGTRLEKLHAENCVR